MTKRGVVTAALGLLSVVLVAFWLVRSQRSNRASSARESSAQPSPSGSERPALPASIESEQVTRIAGRVTDSEGKGLVGANACVWPSSVVASTQPGQELGAPLACTHSGSDGRFEVALDVRTNVTLLASHKGYRSGSYRVDGAGDATNIWLVLPQAAGVSGRVLDASGGPIAGAQVLARPDAPGQLNVAVAYAISDDDGTLWLGTVGGLNQLRVSSNGYATLNTSLTLSEREPFTVLMTPAAELEGIVVNTAGAALAGASVELVEADRKVWLANSDAQGHFSVTGLAVGDVTLEAALDGEVSAPTNFWLNAGRSKEAARLVISARAAISGRVNVGGVPCDSGEVVFQGEMNAGAVVAGGRFAHVRIPLGEYRATARCAGALPQELSFRASDANQVLDWNLEAGGTVRGRIVTAGGRPLAGRTLRLSKHAAAGNDGEDYADTCLSDLSGRFVCSGLEAGPLTLSLLAGPHVVAEAQTTIPTSHGEEIALVAPAVADIAIERAPGQRADVIVDGTTKFYPRVEANGELFARDVPLGRYVVRYVDSPSGQEITLGVDGEVVTVTLPAPAQASLDGQVVRNATGVPDVWVDVFSPQALGSAGSQSCLTDSDGRFHFEIPQGQYTLRARYSGGQLRAAATTGEFVTLSVEAGTTITPSG